LVRRSLLPHNLPHSGMIIGIINDCVQGRMCKKSEGSPLRVALISAHRLALRLPSCSLASKDRRHSGEPGAKLKPTSFECLPTEDARVGVSCALSRLAIPPTNP